MPLVPLFLIRPLWHCSFTRPVLACSRARFPSSFVAPLTNVLAHRNDGLVASPRNRWTVLTGFARAREERTTHSAIQLTSTPQPMNAKPRARSDVIEKEERGKDRIARLVACEKETIAASVMFRAAVATCSSRGGIQDALRPNMVHRLEGLPQPGQVLPSIDGYLVWSYGMQSVLAPAEGARESSASWEAALAL